MAEQIERISSALAAIGELLRADGYDLQVDGLASGVLRVSVLAGSDACSDCLVPKAVMEVHILRAIATAEISGVRSLRIRYPGE